MKKHKNLKYILSICMILIVGQIFAQNKKAGEEPYPAPAMYDNLTTEEAAFIALFDDKNIGNTHVYVPRKGEKLGDHEPYGSVISNTYGSFLPSDMQRMVNVKGSEPRALYSIRGGNGELYVIQAQDFSGKQHIGLYALSNEKLTKIQDLASLTCDKSGCKQMDSWLQDIDGDTRIDIIQKVMNQKGEMNTKTYRIQRDGSLKMDEKLTIDETDYVPYDYAAPKNIKAKN